MIELTAVQRAGNRLSERGVRVDPVVRRAAELTAELVSRQLGIKAPTVRWLPPSRKDIRGETLPADLTEIWIVAGQSVAATVETTAHECRHAWQLQEGAYRWLTPGLKTMDEREQDAHDYGRRIRAELT